MSRPFPPELAEDPVWQAILRAPSEEETPEEAAMVARAKAMGFASPGCLLPMAYSTAMSFAVKKAPATIADLLAIPENERFHEIIGGELVRKALPSIRHGGAQAGLTIQLGGPYNRRAGGRLPGGWRFATETEIRFEDAEVYRPDVAGWRRDRMPELPHEFPVTVRPDWVCEIVSPSNERNDIVKKMRTYQRCGVPHYWVLDPIAETLIVYRWTEGGFLLVQSAQGEERVRAEPFDAVSLSVHGLLEGNDDE